MDSLLQRLEDHLINFHKDLELNYARKSAEVLCRILLKNVDSLPQNHNDLYGQKLVEIIKPETISVSKNHTKKN